jgi:phosphatidylserine/phosphatidylglycerophosphate/cardiolipin synthase-like enzyme
LSDQTLQQFIESNKTQYAIQKGIQTSNEYIAIITPYVNQIVLLESQLKALQEKFPKKERVKIIKQKKKGKK